MMTRKDYVATAEIINSYADEIKLNVLEDLVNDFIEMFADLGIVGGLLFAGMFVMILVFSLQVWFKDAFEKYRLSTTILLMAVAPINVMMMPGIWLSQGRGLINK